MSNENAGSGNAISPDDWAGLPRRLGSVDADISYVMHLNENFFDEFNRLPQRHVRIVFNRESFLVNGVQYPSCESQPRPR